MYEWQSWCHQSSRMILSFLISERDQVSSCFWFRKMVWKTWSLNGLLASLSWYWKLLQSKPAARGDKLAVRYDTYCDAQTGMLTHFELARISRDVLDEVHWVKVGAAPLDAVRVVSAIDVADGELVVKVDLVPLLHVLGVLRTPAMSALNHTLYVVKWRNPHCE